MHIYISNGLKILKVMFCGCVITTEKDRERTRTSSPYLISHGQKIESTRVLLTMRSEVADCVCASLQVWSAQCGRNISVLEVAQTYLVSLRPLFGKDLSRPTFCSIADGAIIRGGIGSLGSPYILFCDSIVNCTLLQEANAHFTISQGAIIL